MSIIATIFGAFVGGLILIRFHIYWSLLTFGFLQAFSNFLFIVLAMIGKNFSFMVFSIFTENFCSGLTATAFMAFLMSLLPIYGYSICLVFRDCSFGSRVHRSFAGMMVENLGWVQFYSWAFLLSFPGILLLFLLRNRVLSHAHVVLD